MNEVHHPETGGSFDSFSLEDVKSGTKALGSFLKHGRNPVDPEHAEARAKICATCPKQIEVDDGCGACRGLYALAKKTIGGKLHTTQDGNLRACGVCRCHGVAHVWVPARDLSEGFRDEHAEPPENETNPAERIYPSWCWKKKEVLEYRESQEKEK
jgi:hypothetical protein